MIDNNKLKKLCQEYLECYYDELPRRSKHMQIAYCISNGHYARCIKIYHELKQITDNLEKEIGMSITRPDNVYKQAQQLTFKLYLKICEYQIKILP